MADIKLLVPKILKWEGGFGNDPADPGGATMKGITLATFQSIFGKDKTVNNLKNITDDQWMHVLNVLFWSKWQADKIKSQSVAEILVDWVWASGKYGYQEPQKLLGLKPDGVVGPMTLAAINNYPNQAELHRKLFDGRMAFIDRIVENSVKKYEATNGLATKNDLMKHTFIRFKQGWKNRLNDSYKTFQA